MDKRGWRPLRGWYRLRQLQSETESVFFPSHLTLWFQEQSVGRVGGVCPPYRDQKLGENEEFFYNLWSRYVAPRAPLLDHWKRQKSKTVRWLVFFNHFQLMQTRPQFIPNSQPRTYFTRGKRSAFVHSLHLDRGK